MWEEVYRFFTDKKGQQLDEEYWLELAERIDQLNHESSLEDLDLSPVQQVLGDRSQCILIKYGLNESELWENFDKIIQVINCLQKGDELYIDITHSFRSLSLFLFLVLVFIKDLAAEKEIKIAGVYYGMLDVISELKYAPVVDLQSLFQLTDWIKGTYSLQSYGDASLIAQLLDKQGEKNIAQELQTFSKAVNIGYLPTIKSQGESLAQNLRSKQYQGPFKHIKKFVEKFLKRFTQKHESDFQLELAGWYFENQRYATGYLAMTESILTYLCEITGKNPDIEQHREAVKTMMFEDSYRHRPLSQLYKEINDIRKHIAHPTLDKREESFSDDIRKASKYHKEIKSIFQSGTWGEDLFRRRT